MKGSGKLWKWFFIGAGMFIVYVTAVFIIPRRTTLFFSNGGSVKIQPASLIEHIFGGKCVLDIKSKTGRTAQVKLSDGPFDSPMLLIPSSDPDVFICIYDYDVDIQLLRINLSQPFHTLPARMPVKNCILGTTCRLDRVLKTDEQDWLTAKNALLHMSSHQYRGEMIEGLNLGLFRIVTDQKMLAEILGNYGNQGVYDEEVAIPSYMQRQTNSIQKLP